MQWLYQLCKKHMRYITVDGHYADIILQIFGCSRYFIILVYILLFLYPL